MKKELLKILLIVACQIFLLTGITFANPNESKDIYFKFKTFEEIKPEFEKYIDSEYIGEIEKLYKEFYQLEKERKYFKADQKLEELSSRMSCIFEFFTTKKIENFQAQEKFSMDFYNNMVKTRDYRYGLPSFEEAYELELKDYINLIPEGKREIFSKEVKRIYEKIEKGYKEIFTLENKEDGQEIEGNPYAFSRKRNELAWLLPDYFRRGTCRLIFTKNRVCIFDDIQFLEPEDFHEFLESNKDIIKKDDIEKLKELHEKAFKEDIERDRKNCLFKEIRDILENYEILLLEERYKMKIVGVAEKNTDKENSKEKIEELYIELNKENILKKVLPRLNAFGIVEVVSNEENNLEQGVTRKEFAKLIMALLNMDEEEVKAAEDLKLFTIMNDDWSPTYVNLATSLGIIDKKDEGSFSSEEPVKFCEAITTLVRVLGYRDEFLPNSLGSWPVKYIAKATKIGITKDVKYNSPSSIVDHGDMIILINNTLRANGLKEEDKGDGGITYQESKETFLKMKFGIDQYNGVKILEIKQDVNSEGEIKLIKFEFLNDIYNDKYKTGDIKTFKLSYDSDVRELQNFVTKEATIYVKDDSEVIYIEK